MSAVINRHPAGTPVGGRFAASHRAGPALVLQDEALLADIDAIKVEVPKLWERLGKAERKATMLELANVAQIAHEHGHDRDALLIIDNHSRQVTGVDDGAKVHEVPQWWSEDLDKADREVLVELPGVQADNATMSSQRDAWTIQIGKALDAERLLMGRQADNPIGYAGRRDRAWEAVEQSRAEHLRAVLHGEFLQVRRVDESAAMCTYTIREGGRVTADGFYDADGEPIDVEVYNTLDALGDEDCFYPDLTAEQLRASGTTTEGDGELFVHFDRLARMRGVADDPSQASLFGKDAPSDYGWRAAA